MLNINKCIRKYLYNILERNFTELHLFDSTSVSELFLTHSILYIGNESINYQILNFQINCGYLTNHLPKF